MSTFQSVVKAGQRNGKTKQKRPLEDNETHASMPNKEEGMDQYIRRQKGDEVEPIGVLKSLVIPIVDRSHYRGFPITKHKTQHGSQLIHTYKPSARMFKRSSANKNLNSRSYNSNGIQT